MLCLTPPPPPGRGRTLQIEEPFSVLPLEDVVDDIQNEINTMYSRQNVVTDVLRVSGAMHTRQPPVVTGVR